ncbi:MAG: hypothetical protein MMC33_005489 [Icmadophila ericetorum]|nr:hypothetical protein [Icmadophila ericetorum]
MQQIFSGLADNDFPGFFAHVVEDVDWNVRGTHPLAGMYHNKTIFVVNSVARLAKLVDETKPQAQQIVNIVGGCNEEWAAVEIQSQQITLIGSEFNNTLAWFTRFNLLHQIVQVRAYLDSALVTRVVTENELPTNSTYTTPRLTLEPGYGGIPNLTGILGPS